MSSQNVKAPRLIGLTEAAAWLKIKTQPATAAVTDAASASLTWTDLDISTLADENANNVNPPTTPRFFSGAVITETDTTVLNAEVGTAAAEPKINSTNASKITLVDTARNYDGRLKIGPASGGVAAGQGNLNFTARVTHNAADGTMKDQFTTDGRWLNLSLPIDIEFTVHADTIAVGDFIAFEVVQRLTITTLDKVSLTLYATQVDAVASATAGTGAATAEATILPADTIELTRFQRSDAEPALFPIVVVSAAGEVTDGETPWHDSLADASGNADLWIARSRAVRTAGQADYVVAQWAKYQATGEDNIVAIQYSATRSSLAADWHSVLAAVGDFYGRVRDGTGAWSEPFSLGGTTPEWRFVTNLGWGGGPLLKTLVTPFDFAGVREVQYRYAAVSADYTNVLWRAYTPPMPVGLIPINTYRADGNYGLGDGLSTYVEFNKNAASFAVHGSQFNTPTAVTDIMQAMDINFVTAPTTNATTVNQMNINRAGHTTGLIEVYAR